MFFYCNLITMDSKRRKQIYSKTDGYCHLCHKKLLLKNYSISGVKGGWQVEHSRAKANGGTDHLNNLFAACISCNLTKGTKRSKTIRSRNGVTRAPYSKAKKESIKVTNTLTGAATGFIAGSPFGPFGMAIGGAIGAMIGNSNSPKK